MYVFVCAHVCVCPCKSVCIKYRMGPLRRGRWGSGSSKNLGCAQDVEIRRKLCS